MTKREISRCCDGLVPLILKEKIRHDKVTSVVRAIVHATITILWVILGIMIERKYWLGVIFMGVTLIVGYIMKKHTATKVYEKVHDLMKLVNKISEIKSKINYCETQIKYTKQQEAYETYIETEFKKLVLEKCVKLGIINKSSLSIDINHK